MLDKTSSIICAFGLAAAAPRSPYRHLELCGIALKTPHRGCTQCTAPVGCFVSGIAFITRNAVASSVVQQGDLADGRIVGCPSKSKAAWASLEASKCGLDAAAQVHLALVDQVDDGPGNWRFCRRLPRTSSSLQVMTNWLTSVGGHAEAHGDDAAGVAGGLAERSAGCPGRRRQSMVDRRAVAIGQLLSLGG